MDSFDAILEQVKRSRAQGLDAIAGRLTEVAAGLAELFPEDELGAVEQALVGLRDEAASAAERAAAAEERATELAARVAALESAPPPPPAPVVVAGAAGVTLELLRRLDRGTSQSDLLKELLPVLAEHAARAVVLVIKGAGVAAWSGIGFANAERLRAWAAADVSASEALTTLANSAELLSEAGMLDAVMSCGFQFKNGAAFVHGDRYSEFNFADKFSAGLPFTLNATVLPACPVPLTSTSVKRVVKLFAGLEMTGAGGGRCETNRLIVTSLALPAASKARTFNTRVPS